MSVRSGHLLARSLQRCALRAPVSSTLIGRSYRRLPATPLLSEKSFHVTSPFRSAANPEVVEPAQEDELITEFAELAEKGLIDPQVIEAITQGMGLKTMTDVQAHTIHASSRGGDMIAQAKTGTGKTIAFLLPVIHRILQDPSLGKTRGRLASSNDIRAVIISPTRELAEQIAVEARRVTRGTGLKVQTAVGGTQKALGLRRIQSEGCHILVGTPGRLIDIFSDPSSGVTAPKLQAFVLDEADRLLDVGFAPEIQRMESLFPSRSEVDRQTLMFSATISDGVKHLARGILKPNFTFVNTVGEEVPTHIRVPQKAVPLKGLENQLPALYEIAQRGIKAHIDDPDNTMPFKAIVYFNSTAEVGLARIAFNALRPDLEALYPGRAPRFQTVEMQSRLSQGQRTFNSETFRNMTSGILFSSDVTARGMDFPNVSHVIQMGVPNDTETYIHRLGRTARANKTGEGWILFTDLETQTFNQKLRRLPIKQDTSLETASADFTNPGQLPESVVGPYNKIAAEFVEIDDYEKLKVYKALHNLFSHLDGRESRHYIQQLATTIWGFHEPPHLEQRSRGGRPSGNRGGRDFGRPRPEGSRFGANRSQGFSGGFSGDRSSRRDPSYSDRVSRGGGHRGGSRGGSRGGFKGYGGRNNDYEY